MAIRSKHKEYTCDVVVVGGGLTGVCAAVASARKGAKTALIQDRAVLGGNASSEIRMHVCGASCNNIKKNVEETGLIHELMLENKRLNDYYNYSLWDAVLLRFVQKEENLKTFMNTSMRDVEMNGENIASIVCYQSTTEINWTIRGNLFIDCTGNGTLGYLSGAEYRTGSESKDEFQEAHAPDVPNKDRMGNTILFKAIDRGHSVEFRTPEWAFHFTEEQLRHRGHGNVASLHDITSSGSTVDTSTNKDSKSSKGFEAFCIDYGYWWIELNGSKEDIIEEYEEIRDDLVSSVYGVWDHMKNGGDHGAENYDLQWVGMLPGVRESRRLVGDYLINENDLVSNRVFEDAVAYGGWPIDIHAKKGLFDFDALPSFLFSFPGVYTIPYRSYYSRNIGNLFIAGRALSATRIGMASTRVMATCAVGGQAVGTAAGLCTKYQCQPRELLPRIKELQQELIKDDCYIPGYRNEDENDLARDAVVSATSQIAGCECSNITNGYTRILGDTLNYWESDGLSENGETVSLTLSKTAKISQVRLTFDTNLSRPLKITLSSKRMKEQQIGVPAELVKDYKVTLWKDGNPVASKEITDNYLRLNAVDFDSVLCDKITVTVIATNGISNARIFEIRAYS